MLSRTEFERRAQEYFGKYWDMRKRGFVLEAARTGLEYAIFVKDYWESFLQDNVHRPHVDVYEDEVANAWDRVAGARDVLYDLENENEWFGLPVVDGKLALGLNP